MKTSGARRYRALWPRLRGRCRGSAAGVPGPLLGLGVGPTAGGLRESVGDAAAPVKPIGN